MQLLFALRITSFPLTFPLLINSLNCRRTKLCLRKHLCNFSSAELKCERSISHCTVYNDYKIEMLHNFHVPVFAFDARKIFGHDF